MYCSNCGKEIPEGELCSDCMEKSGDANAEETLQEPNPQFSLQTGNVRNEAEGKPDKPRKKKAYIIVSAIIMGVLLVAVAGLSYLLFFGKSPEPFFAGIVHEDLIAAKLGDKWGYINSEGKFEINPQFDTVSIFSKDGLAVFSVDGKYGYIKKDGSYAINPQFDGAYLFDEKGYALVKAGEKCGYIDRSGKYIINPQFEYAYSFDDEGYALVRDNAKYGYIDRDGKYVINPQFDDLSTFDKNGLARVNVNGKFGYIDRTGKNVINPQYDDVSFFDHDGYAIVVQNKKIGVIDVKGNLLIRTEFDGIKGDDYLPGTYQTSDYCKEPNCGNKVAYGSEYCTEHKSKDTSSTTGTYLPYCAYSTCLNKVQYSWKKYCTVHSYLE